MMFEFTPERALFVYHNNVENFDEATPILSLIGEHLTPIALDLPSDAPELAAPEVVRAAGAASAKEPLHQAVLNVEAEVMGRSTMFGGYQSAVVIYAAGSSEFRLVAPFRRTPEGVVWDEARSEVLVGPDLDRDPVIVALRQVVASSREEGWS